MAAHVPPLLTKRRKKLRFQAEEVIFKIAFGNVGDHHRYGRLHEESQQKHGWAPVIQESHLAQYPRKGKEDQLMVEIQAITDVTKEYERPSEAR